VHGEGGHVGGEAVGRDVEAVGKHIRKDIKKYILFVK
jgi:hypothetical protein